MNNSCRTARVSAYTTRVNHGHSVADSARMTLGILGPSVCAMAIANTICGTARKMSDTRMISPDHQVSSQPASNPSGTPTTSDVETATSEMMQVTRAPNSRRLNISAPIRSVPNQWAALGGRRRIDGVSL